MSLSSRISPRLSTTSAAHPSSLVKSVVTGTTSAIHLRPPPPHHPLRLHHLPLSRPPRGPRKHLNLMQQLQLTVVVRFYGRDSLKWKRSLLQDHP
ncbi:hypothetical protein ACFX2J_003347 [Malus domestica]